VPTIRGKFIAELEDSMPLRRKLRVLLWIEGITQQNWPWLEDLERLRLYLNRGLGDPCTIQLLLPSDNLVLAAQAQQLGLDITIVDPSPGADEVAGGISDTSLRRAVATGTSHDADYIVVPTALLPYIETVDERFHIGLTDPSFLLKCAEVFVRGFDVAWSFTHPVVNQTFTTLYQFSESAETFEPGFTLMNLLGGTRQNSETIETGRTLIFNRMANLCFSRDRLLFYGLQREAALRLHANRQTFAQELAYYLNFYYLLLYGAFDHAALLVNGVYNLGLKKKEVGATYRGFLEALEKASPILHGIFTKPSTVELLDRFGALRHYAAHRGSIAPSKIVEKPDKEPTDDEVDAVIRRSSANAWMLDLPDGPQKATLVGMLRSNTRMEIYEENTVAKDVVLVEIRGKDYILHPLSDTTWNFRRTVSFLHEVFGECIKLLS
jgi:hypothetical protein